MRKLLYFMFLLGVASWVVVACDDTKDNPGDFSLKATLEVEPVLVSVKGNEYALNVARVTDTTYRYFYTENDTTKDENGEPVIGSDGKLIIKVDTIYYNSKVTAKFTEYELPPRPTPLPSACEAMPVGRLPCPVLAARCSGTSTTTC